MEKVRVTNEQNTRVSTTQEERKTAYVEEISQKKIADAKAKSARVIAEATQDGKNYVANSIAKETQEKTFKAGLTRKEAARKQVLLGKHVLRLKIRAYRELKEKDWIKTNGPGAKQVQRLQRRAERHTRDYARRNSRNQRRAVAKSIHKMAQQGRHLSRNIRAVAERAYDDLQKVEKVEENQPVKSHVEKMDRRRRYVSTFEKSLTSVASQFGSAHHAADAAVDDVVHEDHLQP